jgi:hypothetical protein
VHKLEETQVDWEFLLGYAPMQAQPTPQERPEAFHGMHMDFTQAVAIFVSSACASSVVHTLMAVSPGLQASIHAVLIRLHQCTGNDGVFDEGLDGIVNLTKIPDSALSSEAKGASLEG